MGVFKQNFWYQKEDDNPTLGHSDIENNNGFIYSKNIKNKSGLTPPMFTTINSNKRYFNHYFNFINGINNNTNAANPRHNTQLDSSVTPATGRGERCVDSEGDANSGSKIKFSGLLRSISFLVILSSVSSVCLALDSANSVTGSVPTAISLLQNGNSSLLSSETNATSINPVDENNGNYLTNDSIDSAESEAGHSGASLIQAGKRLSFSPLSKITSFVELALSSGSTLKSRATSRAGAMSSKEKKKRSGGNRRSSKKKSRDEAEEKRTIWSEYMAKFDIAKVHGSGVYVDLGGYATVGSYDYRMPTGKCPVLGKAIVLENGADFLKSITHHDVKERGLAFPATKVTSNSSKADMENQLLSPISAQVLRSWNYKHESDVSNCAEYSKNIVPGSNRDSKYRYPFVYDQTDKLCYILYSPMQYNQGVKYCDTDSSDEGTSSLACMYPDKDKEDSHLFYGTSAMHMDWNVVCPVYPIKDAIFGSYDQETDECTAIEPIYVEDADDYAECSKILFEYSPSDVDVSSNNQVLSDVDRYKEAMEAGKLSTALSIMFSPRYSEDRPIYTRGVGINWATYNINDKKCNILDEVPTCLIISNGNFALTSLSSPSEEDAIPYPCNIKHGKGFVRSKKKKKETQEKPKEEKEEKKKDKDKKDKDKEDKKSKKTATNNDQEFIPYTSLKTDGFVCDKFVHTVTNSSCGSYLECSTTPPQLSSKGKKILKWVLIGLAIAIVVAIAAYFGYKYFLSRRFKKYDSESYDENNMYYDSEHDFNNYNSNGNRNNQSEFNVNNEEGIWSRNEPHNSDVTPVRISRIERHN